MKFCSLPLSASPRPEGTVRVCPAVAAGFAVSSPVPAWFVLQKRLCQCPAPKLQAAWLLKWPHLGKLLNFSFLIFPPINGDNSASLPGFAGQDLEGREGQHSPQLVMCPEAKTCWPHLLPKPEQKGSSEP